MAQQTILFETRDEYHLLTLNRPSALNAFDRSMLETWRDALSRIEDKTKPLILTGTGRAFSTGGDLKRYLGSLADIDGLRAYFDILADVFEQIAEYPGPTIAAVNGIAVAGGLEAMCLCDVAVAAKSATFADGHLNYGLHPGGGASASLPWLIGERRARWFILSGEFIDAAEAERIGLVNRVVSDSELFEEAQRMAAAMARHSPCSIRRTKELMKRDIASVLRRERDSLLQHFQSPETKKRLESFSERSLRKRT